MRGNEFALDEQPYRELILTIAKYVADGPETLSDEIDLPGLVLCLVHVVGADHDVPFVSAKPTGNFCVKFVAATTDELKYFRWGRHLVPLDLRDLTLLVSGVP